MLAGKVALVTGSGRGIGRSIALMLAERGADLVISDIQMENVLKVGEEIKALGRKSMAIKADVVDEEEVDNMVKTCIDKFGKLDILVNNAGMVCTKTLPETSVEEFERVIGINLKGVFICTKAVYPYMVKQKSGKIINIASVAGKRGGGFLGRSAYSAAKGGIIAFTKAIAREGGPHGINVNAICPGMTETEMIKDLTAEQRTAVLNSIPLGRPGQTTDIAKAVCFLASSDSDYITGEIMDVDGGIMMD